MKNFPRIRSARGFSLLEVLVAIVVLSIGLLALAILQLNLIRSGGDAKAQSVALALAKEQLEAMRAFHVWSDATADDPANQLYTDYVSIDDDEFTRTEGGTEYNITVDVQRYSLENGGTFEEAGNTDSDADMTAAGFVAGRDFKRASVMVEWTEAAGGAQFVTLEDVIDGLIPADSARVAKNTAGSKPRTIQILINDPGSEVGVIPIAINTNDPNAEVSTAATNPKPEIGGNNNSQRVYETRFDVLTYAGLNSGDFLAQARVETTVLSCTCDTALADEDVTGYRPTYWNGIRYVAPTLATYTQPAGWAFEGDNNADESDKCSECCRDHHDPDGITGAKFDPRRVEASQGNSAHEHYFVESDGTLTAAADNGGQYTEVCRMIRVDGIFRVAADMYTDYFNLLEAENDGSADEFAPTADAKANYQDMVLDYLDTRITLNDVSDTFNDLLSTTTVATMESDHSINEPALLTLNQNEDDPETDGYWLHSRGLYIDYMEPSTIAEITEAQEDCKGTDGNDPDTDSEREACVLPLVPFTSINLTELSNWSPLVNDDLRLTNSNFLCSEQVSDNDCNGIDPDSPTRGKAYAGDDPTDGTQINGHAQINSSNAGLALINSEIDDAPWNVDGNGDTLTFDDQPFELAGGAGNNTTYYYTVQLSTWFNSKVGNPTECPWGSTPQTDEDATCTLGLIAPAAQTVSWSDYNYQLSTTSTAAGTGSLTLPCYYGAVNKGNKTKTGGTGQQQYSVNRCRNFQVSSVTVNGVTQAVSPTVTSPGLIAEVTSVPLTSVPANATVVLNWTEQASTYLKPTTCTCSNSACSTASSQNFGAPASCP